MKAKDCCHTGHGLQKFSDYTTMHGFRELYYSKSLIWKFVWFLIVAAAIAVSVYQLNNTIVSAIAQPTTTLIQPLNQDIEYPPLKICYLHWMYWVNWTSVYKFGFDRNTFLYGASFLSDIVSNQTFNYTQAKLNFESAMKKNKFDTIVQFYNVVSAETPPGISTDELPWTTWKKVIDLAYNRLCYVADSDMITNGLTQLASKTKSKDKTITLLSIYGKAVVDFNYVYPAEVETYMKQNLVSLLKRNIDPNVTVNFLDYKVAPVLNVDNIKVNYVMPSKETFSSMIKISGSLYNWLHSYKRPCNPGGVKWYYDYCDTICYWEEVKRTNPKSCMNIEGAILLNMNSVENMCHHNVTFLDNPQTIRANYVATNYIQFTSQAYNACIAQYCMPPCIQWLYGSTVSSLPVPSEIAQLNFPTTLLLEYPNMLSILTYTEIETQTWETIVGNLGGIVGLWLGASILSLLQMFYLLCCENCDEKIAGSIGRKLVPQHVHLRRDMHSNVVRPKTVVISSLMPSKSPVEVIASGT